MAKLKEWSIWAIALALGLPLALAVAGALFFATGADSVKMRLMSASMNGKPVEITSSESFRLMLSRVMPVPSVILGLVGEWYWLKGLFALMK
jgi:hypothetical protein